MHKAIGEFSSRLVLLLTMLYCYICLTDATRNANDIFVPSIYRFSNVNFSFFFDIHLKPLNTWHKGGKWFLSFIFYLTNAFISFGRLHILFISSHRSSISLSFAHMPLKAYCVRITGPTRFAPSFLFCGAIGRDVWLSDIIADSHFASVWHSWMIINSISKRNEPQEKW